MKVIGAALKEQRAKKYFLFLCGISLVLCMMGCIRLSGHAGYSHVQDDKMISKSTGFDLDSANLMPQKNVS